MSASRFSWTFRLASVSLRPSCALMTVASGKRWLI